MEAKTEFELEDIDRGFLEFCEEQDKPVAQFDRWKTELFFRAIGYSKKPIPETDGEIAEIDLMSLERGMKLGA